MIINFLAGHNVNYYTVSMHYSMRSKENFAAYNHVNDDASFHFQQNFTITYYINKLIRLFEPCDSTKSIIRDTIFKPPISNVEVKNKHVIESIT